MGSRSMSGQFVSLHGDSAGERLRTGAAAALSGRAGTCGAFILGATQSASPRGSAVPGIRGVRTIAQVPAS